MSEQYLATVPVFSELPVIHRVALQESGRRVEYDRGDLVFFQGQSAEAAYLLLDGQIRLSKDEASGRRAVITFVLPGEPFALVAGMQTTTYPVNAEAVRRSSVVVWPRESITRVFQACPEIAGHAVQIVSKRMREIQNRCLDLATHAVPVRLRAIIQILAERSGNEMPDGSVAIDLHLTLEDLAGFTGSTVFTISRILSSWEEKGIVRRGRASLTVVDREALSVID